MKKWKLLLCDQHGNIAVVSALVFMALLAITGLALDGGMLYMEKTALQKTANAAALSGAQELTIGEQEAKAVAAEVIRNHHLLLSSEEIQTNGKKSVTVRLEKSVKLAFSPLFGKERVAVAASAAAGIEPMGAAKGASPLGIDDSIALAYYEPYTLKVASGDSESGYFGILALGGPGARTYEQNLRYGYQFELNIGEIVDTQTGNIAGATRQAIAEKVNSCPENPRDVFDRECARVLLVPVYKPVRSGNQVKQVQITGFAYFYITDPMNAKDTSVTGLFIKRTGPGGGGAGAEDKGAYRVRLLR